LGTVARRDDAHRAMISVSGFAAGFILDARTAVTLLNRGEAPSDILPGGVVRVGTVSAEGSGIGTLRFGGGTDATEMVGTRLESRVELSRPIGIAHRLRLGVQADLAVRRVDDSGSPGLFTYLSLQDLVANRPSSFIKVTDKPTVDARTAQGGAWLAETWTASRRLTLDGGVRLDGARVPSTPLNVNLAQRFGIATTTRPVGVAFSPRVGFAWIIRPQSPRMLQIRIPGTNQMTRMAGARLDRDQVQNTGNAGTTLYASIGRFQGVVSPDRINSVLNASGRNDGQLTLSCVGPAVPTPDWAALESGSEVAECVDDGQGPTFAATTHAAMAFAPGFQAFRPA
jgi:hypothetical protein